MKSKDYLYFVLATLCALLINLTVNAQADADNYKMLYKFRTVKQADQSRLLEVSFVGRNKEDRKDILPIYDAEIYFYNVGDTMDVELGVARTNNEGIAQLVLPEGHTYLLDEEGFIPLKAEFKGSDGLKKKRKKLKVKDVFLDLELTEVDSVKTVILQMHTLDSAGQKVPVEEADIIFSVEGMISRLPIEEETLEEGIYEFEFPEDIPGDKDGMIKLHVFIDDHDDYGYVEYETTVDWGVFDDRPAAKRTALWSDVAPIWMYVVLTLLLLGVWANYLYTVVSLMKIKKTGKE